MVLGRGKGVAVLERVGEQVVWLLYVVQIAMGRDLARSLYTQRMYVMMRCAYLLVS